MGIPAEERDVERPETAVGPATTAALVRNGRAADAQMLPRHIA